MSTSAYSGTAVCRHCHSLIPATSVGDLCPRNTPGCGADCSPASGGCCTDSAWDYGPHEPTHLRHAYEVIEDGSFVYTVIDTDRTRAIEWRLNHIWPTQIVHSSQPLGDAASLACCPLLVGPLGLCHTDSAKLEPDLAAVYWRAHHSPGDGEAIDQVFEQMWTAWTRL